ncbi:MAG: SCO family protein [Acidobacteria bacterium]|nr:SCO family protein [Acidobacteriota bacterium]
MFPLLLIALGCSPSQQQPSATDDLPLLGVAPEFSLTERSGRQVDRSELDGRVWVANFVFTECTGPCPLLSQRMSRIQKALEDQPEVRLVSFTVDPENDTPEVLTKYAKRFNADPVRWLFLTGDKTGLYRLIKGGFKLAIDDGGEAPGPDSGIITHSLRFVLVDRQGRIRGYFQGGEGDLEEKIIPAIRRLLAETT